MCTFLICLSLAMTTAGCSFKSPSMAEQQYLIQKGAFPGGVPEWVASPAPGGNFGGSFAGGFIPQSFVRRNPGQSESEIANAQFASSAAGSSVLPRALVTPAETKTKTDSEESKSPLHRIAAVCSSAEADVNDALLTTDLHQRIRKYESLTVRCPNSADLWLWLGKDYAKDGQPVKAGRCYERALIADASLKEAQDLLDENRKELNKKGEPAGASAQ